MNQMAQYGADERLFTFAQSESALRLARVLVQHRSLYRVVTEEGESAAEVSGRFRHEALSPADYPAVGDFVLVTPATDAQSSALIQRVLPRKSTFTRKAAGDAHVLQVVAANIDVAFLCMSLNHNFNISRMERYLSVAWDSGATPVVVLTKADLCPDVNAALAQLAPIALGAEVLVTSATDADAAAALRAYIGPGRTATFLGSSGVGKSTLINALLGESRMQTSALSGEDRGRHTTTHRELLLLPGGGVVIDTPGMRELGVDAVDLARTFADIEALAEKCRFRDCTHTGEPGCAVRQALESGELDPRRLESFRKLQREARYDGLSARGRESEKINAMFGSKRAMKTMLDAAKNKNRIR